MVRSSQKGLFLVSSNNWRTAEPATGLAAKKNPEIVAHIQALQILSLERPRVAKAILRHTSRLARDVIASRGKTASRE